MDELPIKVGALYFLYMLHETQPVPYKYERERLREQQKVERGEPTYPRLQPRPPYQVQISIGISAHIILCFSWNFLFQSLSTVERCQFTGRRNSRFWRREHDSCLKRRARHPPQDLL